MCAVAVIAWPSALQWTYVSNKPIEPSVYKKLTFNSSHHDYSDAIANVTSGLKLIKQNTDEFKTTTSSQQGNSKDQIICDKRKFIVFRCVKRCGGLGDRQKGMISSYLAALLTNRTFIIDMQIPCALETSLVPNEYDWITCKEYAINVPNEQITHIQRIGKGTGYPFNSLEVVKDWTTQVVFMSINWYAIDLIRNLVKENNISHMQWLIDTPNTKVIYKLMNVLFRPIDSMTSELDDFLSTHVRGKTLICGHVRVGKNPSMPSDVDFHQGFRGYPNITKILSFFSQFSDYSKYVIYLATDSVEVRQNARAALDNIVSLNKTIVHVDRYRQDKHDEACTGLYDAVQEQMLLTRCNEYLLTKSNFGVLGALMGNNAKSVNLYKGETQEIVNVSLWEILDVHKLI